MLENNSPWRNTKIITDIKKVFKWLAGITLALIFIGLFLFLITLKANDPCSRNIFTILERLITAKPWTGNCIKYHDQGLLRYKGQLVEGKYEGVWNYYNLSGDLSLKANFNNNEREGTWIYFDENGNIAKTEEYIEGRLIETTSK